MHSFLSILERSGQVDSMKPLYQDYLVVKVWSEISFSLLHLFMCSVDMYNNIFFSVAAFHQIWS